MAWDSSRPVAWKRLIKEWTLYAGIMAAIFVVFFRDNGLAGAIIGLLVSLPLYLGLGYVLAKGGYQRKNFRELRAERLEAAAAPPPTTSDPRPRPAPTSRTTSSTSRPTSPSKRRR